MPVDGHGADGLRQPRGQGHQPGWIAACAKRIAKDHLINRLHGQPGIREGCLALPVPKLEDLWAHTYATLPDALVAQRADQLAYEASFEEA